VTRPSERDRSDRAKAVNIDDALASYDAAVIAIPPGPVTCTIIRGELIETWDGKPAYRLTLEVADGPHRGFRLYRSFTFDSNDTASRSKLILSPLGLKTSADLSLPFPGAGRTLTVDVLVGAQTRPDGYPVNRVLRIELVSDEAAHVAAPARSEFVISSSAR
jgi:hypothetical protein